VAVPAEPSAQRAKPVRETEETTLPIAPTPTPLAGNVPRPAPAAEAGSATTEWPPLTSQAFAAFGSISQFQAAQRMATMLARSSIIPENFRGEEHVGDCVIVLVIANRIGAPILAVMQNFQFFRGKPGWSSQFLISCVNAFGRALVPAWTALLPSNCSMRRSWLYFASRSERLSQAAIAGPEPTLQTFAGFCREQRSRLGT